MSDTPSNGYLRFPTKLFEIRDRGTFMPMMAVRLMVRDTAFRHNTGRSPIVVPNQMAIDDNAEEWLLRRAGYGREQINDHGGDTEPYVIFIRLVEVDAEYDAFSWQNQRTLGVAHRYIIEHWNELVSGQVIDVQHILGESDAPKTSERSLNSDV
jgi:hypothetical protein